MNPSTRFVLLATSFAALPFLGCGLVPSGGSSDGGSSGASDGGVGGGGGSTPACDGSGPALHVTVAGVSGATLGTTTLDLGPLSPGILGSSAGGFGVTGSLFHGSTTTSFFIGILPGLAPGGTDMVAGHVYPVTASGTPSDENDKAILHWEEQTNGHADPDASWVGTGGSVKVVCTNSVNGSNEVVVTFDAIPMAPSPETDQFQPKKGSATGTFTVSGWAHQ